MVNISTNIYKMNNNLSPETIEHQKTTRYGVGKSRSWLGTGTTNMVPQHMVSENPDPVLGQTQQIWLYIKYSKITNYLYISPLVFFIRLSYNLPVCFVLLCNCSVLSAVSVKNENYKKKIKKN